MNDFLPILEANGVDVVLTGHYHVYQRLLPIGQPGKKPILHITSGGDGGQMGGHTISPLVSVVADVHHSLIFQAKGDTLDMIAQTPDGTVLDRYTLRQQGAIYDEATMKRAVVTSLAQQARLFYHLLTHPHVRRADFVAQPHSPIKAGQQITFTLKRNLLEPSRVPKGASLRIEQAPESKWELPAQTIDLASESWTFQAMAPSTLTSGRIETMRMKVNLVVDGFAFEPEVVAVTFESTPQ